MLDRDTRRRVLEAAGPIFAAKGFSSTTVREICDRADANVSAVNYHFRSKEQLYVETVQHAYESLAERVPLPTWPPGTPPQRRLADFVHRFLERLQQPEAAWHCDLIMREVSEPTGAATAAFVSSFVRPTFEMLMTILNDLVPPQVPMSKRHLLTMSIVGQCLHQHHARHITPLLLGEAEASRQTVDLLAEHITTFSLAALERLYPQGGKGGER